MQWANMRSGGNETEKRIIPVPIRLPVPNPTYMGNGCNLDP